MMAAAVEVLRFAKNCDRLSSKSRSVLFFIQHTGQISKLIELADTLKVQNVTNATG